MRNIVLSIIVFVFGIQMGYSQHDSHNDVHHESALVEASEEMVGQDHNVEEFNAGEMIMHHIGDAHDFHIFGKTHMPLPIIVYNTTKGKLDVFLSSKLRAHHTNQEHTDEGTTHTSGHHEITYKGYAFHHDKLVNVDGDSYLDFSITKNVFTALMAAILMIVIFTTVAKSYAKRGIAAPKGIQSFFEPIIIFIRDEVAKPYLGYKANKYLPYLLTVFFFIWFLNMIGLIPFFPGSANVTGNIGVTLVLACFTFFITQFSGNKQYWSHIFKPDVPVFLYPIIVPVEILGMFTKPFALMVRLMANISAGHIIILALVSLVFIFGNAGQNFAGGLTGGVVATAFGLFMNFMELLVAAIQAFIFTVLSAVFIGMAVEEHH